MWGSRKLSLGLRYHYMNHEVQLGEHADHCDVCHVPIKDLSAAVTKEYLGKVLTFCSDACLERYLDDPAAYAEFPGDEPLE